MSLRLLTSFGVQRPAPVVPEPTYDEWLKSLEPIAFFRMADADGTMVDEMGNVVGAHTGGSATDAPILTGAGARSYSGGASSSFTQPAALASSEYTTLLWVVVDSSVVSYAAMFSGRSPDGPYTSGHSLETDGTNFLHAFGTGAGSVDAWAGTLTKGVPVRLALVRTSGGTTHSYLNGVETDARASTYSPLPQGTLVELGKRGSGLNFTGLIWDVALFDKALTAQQIAEDYARASGQMVISAGGTYSGTWSSDDPNTPAVTILTTDPVTITDSTITSKGHCIHVPFGTAANLTVKNTTGIGLNPNVIDASPGRFVHADTFANLIIENNYLEGTSGIYAHTWAGGGTLKVRYNRAKNIMGAYSDGADGWKNGAEDFYRVQFVQLNDVHSIEGAEIAWNEVINLPYESRSEDVINIYDSSGTSISPIDIHNNYIQGSYPMLPESQGFSGSGIMMGDAQGSYQIARDNHVVNCDNVGIGIIGGTDNLIHNNRIISSGKLQDGTILFASNSGIQIWNLDAAPAFDNNGATDNTMGVVQWPGGVYTRNDYWIPDAAFFTNNTALPDPVNEATDAAEKAAWDTKVSTAGVTIGPTT